MGYFSQRKKNERENIVLKFAIIFLTMLSVVILFAGEKGGLFAFFSNLRFQIFIVISIVFAYSLYQRRTIYAFLSLVIMLFFYGLVSSHANLFFNTNVSPKRILDITFSKNYEPKIDSPNFTTTKSGYINLSNQRKASFLTIKQYDEEYTIVSLNLTYLNKEEYSLLYNNLSEFVIQRDEPIIIVGNFGLPAWHPVFKRFLSVTSLGVKNKILLRDNQGSFNPFITPRVNVIGFDNVGIDNISFTPNSRNILKLRLFLR